MAEEINQLSETPITPSSAPVSEIKPSLNSKKPLVMILGILVGFLVIGGAVYGGMKLQEKKTTPTPSGTINQTQNNPTIIPTVIPTEDTTTGWKTYTNSNFAYSYKYPSNWQAFTNKFNANNSLFGPDAKSDSGLGGVEVNKFSGTIDDFMNGVEAQYSGKVAVNIGGISGIRYNSKSINISGTGISLKKDNYLINIYINSQLPADVEIFDQMLSTFKFLDSSQTDVTGWKTYTNSEYKISFKYPNGWGIRGISIPQGYLPNKGSFAVALGSVAVGNLNDDASDVEITSYDLTNPDQKGEFDLDLDTAQKTENIKVGENNFIKYTGVNLNVAPDKYKRLDFWVIKSGNLGAKIQAGSRVSGNSVKQEELNQILSTFKFTQ